MCAALSLPHTYDISPSDVNLGLHLGYGSGTLARARMTNGWRIPISRPIPGCAISRPARIRYSPAFVPTTATAAVVLPYIGLCPLALTTLSKGSSARTGASPKDNNLQQSLFAVYYFHGTIRKHSVQYPVIAIVDATVKFETFSASNTARHLPTLSISCNLQLYT